MTCYSLTQQVLAPNSIPMYTSYALNFKGNMISDLNLKHRREVIPISASEASVKALENLVEAFLESGKNIYIELGVWSSVCQQGWIRAGHDILLSS